MEKIRIIILSYHPAMLKTLRQVLSQEMDFIVCGIATSIEAVVQLAGSLKPDVAIVEYTASGFIGIEAAKKIKKNSPDTAVLVLADYSNSRSIFSLVESGASGYFITDMKNINIHDISNAVRAVLLNKLNLYRTPGRIMKSHASFPLPNKKREAKNLLTERELQVLKMASNALDDHKIAMEMGISVHTIKAHLQNISRKLQVSPRSKAVQLALKKGWLSLDDWPTCRPHMDI